MSTDRPIRIRARTAASDPAAAAAARNAVTDLPRAIELRRPHTPKGLLVALGSLRRPIEPDRVIVMTLAPVAIRSRD